MSENSFKRKILEKIKNIEELPTLPAVITKLSKMLQDSNTDIKEIEKVLASDPAIASKVLKTVNSPIFNARGKKIDKLSDAISRLGFREVRNISLGTAVFTAFETVKEGLFNRKDFWKHSFFTSLISVELGKLFFKCRISEDELHIAGLVHDIGKIILDAYFNEVFEQCLALSVKEKLPLYKAENIVMDIDHTEIGFMIAKDWNLPDIAMASIKFHHIPDNAEEEYKDVVFIVHLANYITNTQELGVGGDFTNPVFQKDVFEYLKISPREIKDVIETVVLQKNHIEEILNE